jgi:predicted alpha/beta superfamily hydrolase
LNKLILFFFISAAAFAQPAQTAKSKPFVLGTIEEIQSTVLNEKRTLNIYLPDGYASDDTTKYPVIYLLDGSADEDFIHVAGTYQFNSFDWVQRAPKSIIVGIANVDRKRDFTFPTTIAADAKQFPTTGHSDRFILFIETELQPYITSKYKVSSSKTLIGESLGGLLAAEILLKKPNLFDKYIIISPSLWWDNGSLLKQTSDVLNENFKQPTEVYIGVGKEGRTPGEAVRIQEDDARALSEKIKASKSKDVSVFFDFLPEESHATIAQQALMNALKFFSDSKTAQKSH